uniref:protein-tyrosine-phosphatase n=1 Tax=Monosiga ovata TaxID=81526 RepID=E5RKD9_9EUKA|nr:protein tyrosine phosphatase type N6 [Monosiga ovata]
MSNRKWFHPHLSGPDAERLLKAHGFDGTFLVRPSKSVPGDYTLSVRLGPEVRHIKIQNTGDYYDLYGGETFATLSELISYYTENEGQLKERSGEVIYLRQPMPCDDPTSARWFHGQISGRECEGLLLSQAQDGSFLVRSSQHNPGDFVLSVRCKDRVSHIMISCKAGQYSFPGGDNFNDLTALVDYAKKTPLVETSGNIVHLKQPFNATKVDVRNLKDRIAAMSVSAGKSSSGFLEEFEKLQNMEQDLAKASSARKEGERPENKAKNRYKNILPYDRTRVVLKDVPPGVVGADYINASHIQSPRGRAYIACQGCLKATVPAFWQMMWEQGATVIAMVTNEVEGGKNKCARYYPDPKTKSMVHGKYTVEHVSEQVFPNFEVRKMTLSKEGQPKRNITQFHYLTWPDHGVPANPTDLISFIESIHEQERRGQAGAPGPLVVHCSAGIGRTGTVIVLDMLMSQIMEIGLQCDIDIQEMVAFVRQQRSGMIQTEAQYEFLYKSLEQFTSVMEQRARAREQLPHMPQEHYGNLADMAPAPMPAPGHAPPLPSRRQ